MNPVLNKLPLATPGGWPGLLIFLAWLLSPAQGVAQSSGTLPALKDGQRILFLGDSITYAGGYVARFDAWLQTRDLADRPAVLNLGLPSETVSGLSEAGHASGRFPRPHLAERLDRVLQRVQPDLVIACYGMNCGIYQPFDEQRLASYQQGIQQLVDKVTTANVPIVLLTPPVCDDARSQRTFSYNQQVLRRYADWLVEQREQAGWHVIDLHAAMTDRLQVRRRSDADFTVQPDGVHPDDEGHQWIADILIQSFAGEEVEPGFRRQWQAIRQPVTQRMKLLRDAWLTHTGHQRPGLPPGLPLTEAEAQADQQSRIVRETLRELPGLAPDKEPRSPGDRSF